MQSPVPWQDVCMASAASSQAGWEMGKGWPAWAEAVGTAEHLCSGSCDIPDHSSLGRIVSLGHCQYNAFQELDGSGFFPHVLSSIQVESSGAGDGAVATGVSVRALPKGHVPSSGVCWSSPAHPYGVVLCHRGSQRETQFCDSIPWGVWDYRWTNRKISTLQGTH